MFGIMPFRAELSQPTPPPLLLPGVLAVAAGRGCRCFLPRLEASGVGSMTAELGPVQRAWCRRLDHGKHVLCCGEWTVAGGWPVAAVLGGCLLSCAAGVGNGHPSLPVCLGRAALELLFIPPTFSSLKPGFLSFPRPRVPRFSDVLFSSHSPVVQSPTT